MLNSNICYNLYALIGFWPRDLAIKTVFLRSRKAWPRDLTNKVEFTNFQMAASLEPWHSKQFCLAYLLLYTHAGVDMQYVPPEPLQIHSLNCSLRS
jgi:hypothetical protein